MFQLAALLDEPAWPMLVVGTIIALLGGGSLIAEKRSQVATAFFLTTAAASTWLLSTSLMMLAASEEEALFFARLTYIGVCAIPAAVFQFSAALTETSSALRKPLAAVWSAALLFAVAFTTSNVFLDGVTRHPWGYYADLTAASGVFLLFFAATLAASLVVLVRAVRGEVSWQHRNRLVSFIAALVVGYGGAIDFLPSFGSIAAPSGYIAVLGFVALSAHAVRRYRLIDLSAAVVAEQLLESIDGGIIVSDTRGIIRLANPGAASLLGYTAQSMRGMNIRAILQNRELPAVETPTMTRLGRASRVLHFTQKNGATIEVSVAATLLRDRERLPVGILYVLHDLAERRRAEVHEFAANHDPLTGANNRTWLMSRFEDVRADTLSRGRIPALLFIDLDGFKKINDQHGHITGDQILQSVAARLRNAIRSEDVLARWGGDEFVALLSLRARTDVGFVSSKLTEVLREPVSVGDLTVPVGASIGVAISPEDGSTLDELVRAADAAMYRMKRGRSTRRDLVVPTPTVLETRA